MNVKITGPDQVDTNPADLSKQSKTPIIWQNTTSYDYTWSCDSCTSTSSILQDTQGNAVVGPLSIPKNQTIGPFTANANASNGTYSYSVQPAQAELRGVGDDPPDMQIGN